MEPAKEVPDLLAKYQTDEPHEKGTSWRPGTISVKVDVLKFSNLQACTWLNLTIWQMLGREKTPTKIGSMVGQMIDLTAPDFRSARLGGPPWMQGLVRDREQLEEQLDELLEVVERLHTGESKSKTSTKSEKANMEDQNHLQTDRLIFVEYFEIYKKYRQPGAGRQPMRMLLNLIPQIVGREPASEEPRAVCVLSPARSDTAKANKGRTDCEIEQALARSYAANGFEVYVQGNRADEGKSTVLGREV